MVPFRETSVLDLLKCDDGRAVRGADIVNGDSEIRGKHGQLPRIISKPELAFRCVPS